MDLSPLIPLSSYAAASITTISCLKQPRTIRLLSLGPVLLLSYLSLATAKNLSWPFGLGSTFASVVVFYLPYSVKILVFDQLPCNPEVSNRPWTFVDCYRIWNNPRNLPSRTPLLANPPKQNHGQQSRFAFALRMLAKAAAFWAFDAFVFQTILFQAFSQVRLADLSPAMELPTLGRALQMTHHELRLRAVMSVQWVWSAYFFLEFYHCLLAVVFVSILRFDRPEEWPALFGSPLEADSIRGFWGRFWHRLTIPTYVHYAQLITRKVMGISPGSRLEKTMIPLFIFTFSGLSHSLVGWAMGDAALSRDTLFFVVNFAAAAAETAVSKTTKSGSLDFPVPSLPGPLRKPAGMAGVFAFFYCVVPMWMYPKVYDSLVGLIP